MSTRYFLTILAVWMNLLPCQTRAYCRATTTAWPGPVRVQLHDLLDDNLRHANGTVWSRAELESTVRFVLADLNESAAADTPYFYLDTSSPNPTCTIDIDCSDGLLPWTACYTPNTIVVLPGCLQTQLTVLNGTPPTSNQHVVHISRSTPTGGIRWTHGSWYAGADNFEMVLLHELGHSLGLGHTTNEYPWAPVCIPNTTNPVNATCPMGAFGCPIMASDRGFGFSAHTFGVDDSLGLRSLYGLRAATATRNFEDPDITSNSFYELPADGHWGISYFSVNSSPGAFAPDLTIGGYLRSMSTVEAGRRIITNWNWSDGSISMVAVPPTSLPSTGPIGVTHTTTSRVVAARVIRNGGDARMYRRRIWADFTPLATTSWTSASTNPVVGAIDDSLTPGLSAAFDPQSGAVLFATRSDSGTIQLVGRLGSSWSQVVSTGITSYTSPAVTCSPTRCLLVLSRPMRPLTNFAPPIVEWIEFSWSQTGTVATYSPTSIFGGGITAHGTAHVGVVANWSGGFDFLVTQTQDAGLTGGVFGSYTWAYRHTQGTLEMTVLAPWVASTPWAHVSSIAGGDSAYAEIFVHRAP